MSLGLEGGIPPIRTGKFKLSAPGGFFAEQWWSSQGCHLLAEMALDFREFILPS